MSKVTVLLPVYNSEKYIRKSIESIINQSFKDWDMLIINEYGSSKKCTKIIKEYSIRDTRIKVIQNNRRLGLAESLNLGIRLAQGEYIARMDADDISHPSRFEKEVLYLDQNPNVVVVGSYQHHFGEDIDWIHKPPCSKEQCKANMLFFCDLCHSTLMLRKKIFIDNNLFYNNSYLAEDFELWSRVISYGDIANIPEVLGEYRVGEDNITIEKKDKLHIESGILVAKILERTLGMKLSGEETYLFNSWKNDFSSIKNIKLKDETYRKLKEKLIEIYYYNSKNNFFDETALLRAIRAKWAWAYAGEPFNRMVDVVNNDIDSIFCMKYSNMYVNRIYYFWINNKGLLKKIKKIIKKIKEKIKSKERSHANQYNNTRI